MSVNRGRPHLMVLPEDDANRELANGFHLGCGAIRQFQVLPPAGGWTKAVDSLHAVHVRELRRNPLRSLVLLIDFDRDSSRRGLVRERIPRDLAERVFLLGTFHHPERLRQSLAMSLEAIGSRAARDCRDGADGIWAHEELVHNREELVRLRERVSALLFPAG